MKVNQIATVLLGSGLTALWVNNIAAQSIDRLVHDDILRYNLMDDISGISIGATVIVVVSLVMFIISAIRQKREGFAAHSAPVKSH